MAYANGTRIALAKVDGGNEWQELMTRVALKSNAPWFDDSSVAVLAEMIQSLTTKSSQRLDRTITAASASMPGHTATAPYIQPVDRLFRDAFAAVGIEYLQIIKHSYQGEPVIGPEYAILAGHNLGLCQPYNSNQSCVRNSTLPTEAYYLVGYYSNELEVTATAETTLAYVLHAYPFVNYHLGAQARHRNPDEQYYWEAVREFLSLTLAEYRRVPTKVILYGDQSHEPRLRDIMMAVLEKFFTEEEMPEWIDDGLDPTFAGAFGAAEFALRKPYWLPPVEMDVERVSSAFQSPL